MEATTATDATLGELSWLAPRNWTALVGYLVPHPSNARVIVHLTIFYLTKIIQPPGTPRNGRCRISDASMVQNNRNDLTETQCPPC